jgi:hypothetical protein
MGGRRPNRALVLHVDVRERRHLVGAARRQHGLGLGDTGGTVPLLIQRSRIGPRGQRHDAVDTTAQRAESDDGAAA